MTDVHEPVIQPPEPGWRDAAACGVDGVDPTLFYATSEEDVERARAFCRACPVQMSCLDHALAVGEPDGIWGGATELERRRIAREVHGTAERYRRKRCRCAPCVDAIERRRTMDREYARLALVAASVVPFPVARPVAEPRRSAVV